MTRREAGRIGGKATVARHGTEHMRAIGQRGFAALARKLGYQGGSRRGAPYRLLAAGKLADRQPRALAPDELRALQVECGLDVAWGDDELPY